MSPGNRAPTATLSPRQSRPPSPVLCSLVSAPIPGPPSSLFPRLLSAPHLQLDSVGVWIRIRGRARESPEDDILHSVVGLVEVVRLPGPHHGHVHRGKAYGHEPRNSLRHPFVGFCELEFGSLCLGWFAVPQTHFPWCPLGLFSSVNVVSLTCRKL